MVPASQMISTERTGNSLKAQWLGLFAFTASSDPGPGTRSASLYVKIYLIKAVKGPTQYAFPTQKTCIYQIGLSLPYQVNPNITI